MTTRFLPSVLLSVALGFTLSAPASAGTCPFEGTGGVLRIDPAQLTPELGPLNGTVIGRGANQRVNVTRFAEKLYRSRSGDCGQVNGTPRSGWASEREFVAHVQGSLGGTQVSWANVKRVLSTTGVTLPGFSGAAPRSTATATAAARARASAPTVTRRTAPVIRSVIPGCSVCTTKQSD